MARWLWWTKGPNYEQELPRLAKEIQNYRTKLISVTARHRRWRALSILSQLVVYLFILSYYFLVVTKPYLSAWQLGHVFTGPLVIYLLHTTLSRGLLWRESRIKKSLQALIVRRQELVDAYKKKINFDLIQKLIDDPQSDPNPNSRSGKSESTAKSLHLQQHKPTDPLAPALNKTKTSDTSAPGNTSPDTAANKNNSPAAAGTGTNSAQNNALPARSALPVYHTSWVDRVMDLVLGENEQGPNNRYALICSKCRVHNGLAPYGKSADEVGYYCPVCHTFNGSEQAVGDNNEDHEKNENNENNENNSTTKVMGDKLGVSTDEAAGESPFNESAPNESASSEPAIKEPAIEESREPATNESRTKEPTGSDLPIVNAELTASKGGYNANKYELGNASSTVSKNDQDLRKRGV